MTWLPNKVKVNHGQIVYLHVERSGGGSFRAFAEPDSCVGGNAFIDGIAQPGLDLAAWVCGDGKRGEPYIESVSFGAVEIANTSFEEGEAGWN